MELERFFIPKVFEQDIELESTVVSYVISIKAQVVKRKESKNSSPSQPGEVKKQEKSVARIAK